jgi:hypothetical protein
MFMCLFCDSAQHRGNVLMARTAGFASRRGVNATSG